MRASALGNWLGGVDSGSSAVDNGLTGRDGRWGGWVLLWELGPTLYVTTPLEVAPTRGGDVHWGVVSTLGSCAGRGSGLVCIGIGGWDL